MDLDEIAAVLEELGAEPNAELVFRLDGLRLDIGAISKHGAADGTVYVDLEEDL